MEENMFYTVNSKSLIRIYLDDNNIYEKNLVHV